MGKFSGNLKPNFKKKCLRIVLMLYSDNNRNTFTNRFVQIHYYTFISGKKPLSVVFFGKLQFLSPISVQNRAKIGNLLGSAAKQANRSMMAEQIKQMVDDKILSKKVFIFSKTRCPFCLKAKKIFVEYKLTPEEYEVMEIEDHPDCAQIQSYLKSITGASSVPRVFINGKCIGGGDDTARLHSSGELAKLLA